MRYLQRQKLEGLKGGANMKAVTMPGSGVVEPAKAATKPKTDWEELAEECRAFAKKTNLTHEEIEKIKVDVRKRLNACGC